MKHSNFSLVDISVLLGLFGVFFLIGCAIMMSGHFGSFINKPALWIVLGGTFFACLISFSLREIGQSMQSVLRLFVHQSRHPSSVALQVVRGSEIAYTSGILQLRQNYIESLKSFPFLKEGVSCLIDGMTGKECQEIMRHRMDALYETQMQSVLVMSKAGEIAPAMGLIGTLIGLVQMLSSLSDPTTVGPSMAVALLTTFYGAVLAYVVFFPLASRLEKDAQEKLKLNQLCLVGLVSIDKKENPRRTEAEMNSLLPASERIVYFKRQKG